MSVAFPLATVGPDAVGGAEQVLAMLDAALVRAGHRSIVIAAEGSTVAGTLVPVPRREGAMSEHDWHLAHESQRRAIAETLARHDVSAVHFHGADFINYLPESDVPALATLHMPPAWYRREVFALRRRTVHLNCVSRSQRLACPPSPLLGDVIGNGVPVRALGAGGPRRDYALALGRICPEKGFHLAIDAARRAGVPLRVAGKAFRFEAHLRYFAEEIAPRLDRDRRHVGPVGLAAKARLLAGARCLLVPSLAPETSSLVAMEALAAGTPVVAFRAGALPEIVEHGVTGFIVDDVASMAEAIGASASLDRETCRRAALARFSSERMAARYVERYQQLAGTAT